MDIFTKQIKSKEYVSLSVIEISSIPDISIIDRNISMDECVDKYKQDFVGVLNEAYQLCKYENIEDVSIELPCLWCDCRN